MNAPRVSVVTPSLDQRPYLRENLDSVRRQSHPDVEHVVVDGGSTDGSVDLLESYAARHGDETGYRLRWVSEPDRGQSHAVNKGLGMATGEWVGWQNSDDLYRPGAFEALASAAERTPAADVVYGDLDIVGPDGARLARKCHTRPSAFVQRHWSLFTANQCTFLRRETFERLGGLDESLEYAMDADLFWRLLDADVEAAYVPRVLGAFRRQPASKSALARERMAEEAEALARAHAGESRLPARLGVPAAVALKALYLLADGRPGAVVSKASEKLRLAVGSLRTPGGWVDGR